MESIIVVVVLAVLAIPVLLVVALVMLSGLRGRVRTLEWQLAQLQSAAARAPGAAQTARPTPMPAAAPAATSAPVAPSAGASSADGISGAPETVAPPPIPPRAPPAVVQPVPVAPMFTRSRRATPAPDAFGRLLLGVRRWFTEGNVPVKVGMLVLLAGVASLLKYAGDQGWLTVPVQLRYAGIAAAALAGLVFGWRQRLQRPGFALALQGGAIGVLLLVVFAAFKLSGLLQPGPAFALTVALVAGLCVLAVKQDSRTLAVLGILAGFLAPIWLSTGSGNHVALFSYYAVLNAAVFAIAWVRPWRVLNLLGFVFTFGIGTLWGVLQYRPAQFASTEPFLLLFFALYLLIPVLHARRRDAQPSRPIDGSLLFGTPLVAFSLQAGLLQGERMPLALCALGLAALYAALAAWLVRDPRSRTLGEGHVLLAVAFATLAVPLALSARATASVLALEGAGLVWLGLRQQRLLPQFSGVALQLLAALGFVIGIAGWDHDPRALANPTFMSALLIALAGFASAAFLRGRERAPAALAAYLWALAWWALAWVHDILRFAAVGDRPDMVLAWLAASAWLAAEVARRRPAAALGWTTMGALVLVLPTLWWQVLAHAQPFAGLGAAAWLVLAVLGTRALWCLRGTAGGSGRAAQFAWWLLWPLAVSLAGRWLSGKYGLDAGWSWALLGWPWLLLAALALLRWPWLAWPQGAAFARARPALLATVFALLGIGWLAVLFNSAGARPLPWIPLLNPAELVQLAVLALAVRWLRSAQAPDIAPARRVLVPAVGGLLLITGTVLHGVHHWGGVAWNDALLSSSLAQTSLTVAWSVLGVLGWVIGSRRGQRGIWLSGALLMAVVLAKLVLVDRQHLGNLLGIGSFIAYGLLCTVVGFLAPAPPRPVAAETEAST